MSTVLTSKRQQVLEHLAELLASMPEWTLGHWLPSPIVGPAAEAWRSLRRSLELPVEADLATVQSAIETVLESKS